MTLYKIAQDIVSGKLFSKTKLAFGADGQAIDVSAANPLPVSSSNKSNTTLPDGSAVTQIGSTTKKWVDDFGGVALDTTMWDLTHVVPGMNVTVTNSELRVVMGTTINAECHLLSKEAFTIPFDIYATMKFSQRINQNDVFLEIVEVDPQTGVPIPNGNLANDWRNRLSAHFAGTNNTTIILESVCDESGLLNTVTNSTQQGSMTDFDMGIELRPADTILTTFATDTAAPRNNTPLRLSKQVPDPNKLYKLRLRFKNGASAPATSTTVTLYRVLMCDIQELVVEVASGRGDQNSAKAIAVNIAQAIPAGTSLIGITEQANSNNVSSGGTYSKVNSAATTNAVSVKAAAGKLKAGVLVNTGTTYAYMKLYNKNSAPTIGTDIVALFIPLPPNVPVNIAQMLGDPGFTFSTGIAYAITGGLTDNDTTAIAAGQVLGSLIYA